MEERQWISEITVLCVFKNVDVGVEYQYELHNLDLTLDLDIRAHPGVVAEDDSCEDPSVKGNASNHAHADLRLPRLKCIIKNTHTIVRDGDDPSRHQEATLSRSTSAASLGDHPILAPERSARIVLEAFMADVWTRDKLPYPAMKTARGTQVLRSSASNIIRRLSKTGASGTPSLLILHEPNPRERGDVELEDPFWETPQKCEDLDSRQRGPYVYAAGSDGDCEYEWYANDGFTSNELSITVPKSATSRQSSQKLNKSTTVQGSNGHATASHPEQPSRSKGILKKCSSVWFTKSQKC